MPRRRVRMQRRRGARGLGLKRVPVMTVLVLIMMKSLMEIDIRKEEGVSWSKVPKKRFMKTKKSKRA
mgnify:CR=1 FL=1